MISIRNNKYFLRTPEDGEIEVYIRNDGGVWFETDNWDYRSRKYFKYLWDKAPNAGGAWSPIFDSEEELLRLFVEKYIILV